MLLLKRDDAWVGAFDVDVGSKVVGGSEVASLRIVGLVALVVIAVVTLNSGGVGDDTVVVIAVVTLNSGGVGDNTVVVIAVVTLNSGGVGDDTVMAVVSTAPGRTMGWSGVNTAAPAAETLLVNSDSPQSSALSLLLCAHNTTCNQLCIQPNTHKMN